MLAGAAQHRHTAVGTPGRLHCGGDSGTVVRTDAAAARKSYADTGFGAQSIQYGYNIAGTLKTGIIAELIHRFGGIGTGYRQAAELRRVERQQAVVFDQHHRFAGGFKREGAVFRSAKFAGPEFNRAIKPAEFELYPQHPAQRHIDFRFGENAFMIGLTQHPAAVVETDMSGFGITAASGSVRANRR